MSCRVLIVDDDALMRKMMSDVLTLEGYHVVGEASDGLQGVVLSRQLAPDLVLMDVMMPELDGIEALRQILEEAPQVRVLMVSAQEKRQVIIEALDIGARDYLVKPFPTAKLLEAVDKAMESEPENC
ncbi:MAG: response regulator [Chloroflexota bacterium]|nr:response regulator [Chloroflexota bacterium]